MASLYRQGDLLPDITHLMLDEDGTAIDLTTATGVVFRFRNEIRGSVVSSSAATVVDAVTGSVSYTLQAGDTDVAGKFIGEFVATFPGGERTSPLSGYVSFTVNKEV